jgi:hypothetical protein
VSEVVEWVSVSVRARGSSESFSELLEVGGDAYEIPGEASEIPGDAFREIAEDAF